MCGRNPLRRIVAGALALPAVFAPASASGPVPLDDRIREAPVEIDARSAGVGGLVVLPEVDTLAGDPLRIGDDRATLIVMTSTTCPLSRKWLPTLARLEAEQRSRGLRTILVDVQGNDRRSEFREFLEAAGFAGDGIHDPDRVVATALGASTTTEAFLLDARRTLRYRGAVDDRIGLGYARATPTSTPLRDAIDAVLEGGGIDVLATTSPGCELGLDVVRPRGEETPTWHGSIVRLFETHCVSCHRAGGVAPFRLDDEREARANAAMIARQVDRGLMPPWFAAPPADGHPSPWMNDRSLRPDERAAIVAWARGERASGDPAVHPLPSASASIEVAPGEPEDPAATWEIGRPDLVVEIPEEIAIPADGYLDYVNIRIDPGFKEDRWVEAWEVLPTAMDAVHHVLVFIRDPETGLLDRDGYLAAYVPGYRSMDYTDPTFSEGGTIAKRLPAGSELHFQLHYTPNGRATSDRTRLALRFTDTAPQREVRVAGISNRRFRIPPGAKAHPVEAGVPVSRDIELFTYLPHMHVRGASFRYELVSPGGDREVLLDVPEYDFNWQLNYVHHTPRPVEPGSRIEAFATFDNSEGNPANPDPAAEVRWGDQTYEEMMIGYVEYLVDHDPGRDASAGRLRPEVVLAALDRNGDGRIRRRECPSRFRAIFDQLDVDGDRIVTLEELRKGQDLLQAP